MIKLQKHLHEPGLESIDGRDYLHLSYLFLCAARAVAWLFSMGRTCQHQHGVRRSLQMVSAEKQITSTSTPDSEGIQSIGQINLSYLECCGKKPLPTGKALANLFSRGLH